MGCGNGWLHDWVGTPPRKIRRQFRKCKHTSLAFLAMMLYELCHDGVLKSREGSFVGPAFASYASACISEHVSVHNTLRNGT